MTRPHYTQLLVEEESTGVRLGTIHNVDIHDPDYARLLGLTNRHPPINSSPGRPPFHLEPQGVQIVGSDNKQQVLDLLDVLHKKGYR